MARSDLLLNLVKAGVQGDRNLVLRTGDAVIAEGCGKQHHVLAGQFEETVQRNGIGRARFVFVIAKNTRIAHSCLMTIVETVPKCAAERWYKSGND